MAITGPSGVGKSTLLAIAGQLLSPTSGSVETHASISRQGHVAWITQSLDLDKHRDVLDNALAASRIDGIYGSQTSAAKEAAEVLDQLGLGDHLRAKAKTLSGGQAQRLVIARALLCDRRLVLADEPTNQLDRSWAATCARMLTTLPPHRALLMVTHDAEVARLCSSMVELLPAGLRFVSK